METTSFTLSGNFWIYIAISVLLIAFSIYSYYHTNPHISSFKKSVLITLRSLGLLALLFILFQPALLKTKALIQKPKLAVLIDNSISNGLTDAKYVRSEIVKKFFKDIDLDDFKDNIDFYTFSEDISKLKNYTEDSLKFNGQITDLEKAFKRVKINSKNENYQAILLVSDGEINSGNNPIYYLDDLAIPIMSVGIGDSIPPKDVILKSIITNEVAFINTPVEVYTEIFSNGYANQTLNINFYENDNLIENAKIEIKGDLKEYNYSFKYLPKKEGTQKLSVSITPLNNEFTDKNNSASTFIKILKNKKIISIFSPAPSPDLSMIVQYLSADKEALINQFVQKSGSEFFNQPTFELIAETQLFILLGFPNNQTPDNVINSISQELSKGKPVLFIAGNQIDYGKLGKFSQYLPFDILSSSNREFNVLVEPSPQALDNPLLRVDGASDIKNLWSNLPPIYKTETFVNPKIDSKILATAKIENVKLNEPLIMTRESQGIRSAAVLAFNLYKWKLSGYAKELIKGNTSQVDLFNIFMNNALRWLSVSNVEKQLIVKTNKNHFSSSESIEFKGNVWDNSLNPIDNARIEIKLKSKSLNKTFDLPSIGGGVYFTKLSPLPKGDYHFNANAFINDKQLASDEGLFTVGVDNYEYLNITMNKKLLTTLSENSGGKFFNVDDYKRIPPSIKQLHNFRESTKIVKSNIEFWNNWILLVIAIFLFSLEWFIRKRLSML